MNPQVVTVNDRTGNYCFKRVVTPEQLIAIANEAASKGLSRGRELSKAGDSKAFLQRLLQDKEREEFVLVTLTAQHKVIGSHTMSLGTINQASVYPREIVKQALADNAAAAVLAHNHPSGEPEPSQADIRLTKRIADALALVDVNVLDHIVVATGGTVSLAERGLM